jgi:Mce-associated membrane protein
VLTTRVVSAAVQSLGPDSATLLVFLDQSATRADRDSGSAAAAQLSVTARREADRWVITNMEPR